jgi:hypothetical protein
LKEIGRTACHTVGHYEHLLKDAAGIHRSHGIVGEEVDCTEELEKRGGGEGGRGGAKSVVEGREARFVELQDLLGLKGGPVDR